MTELLEPEKTRPDPEAVAERMKELATLKVSSDQAIADAAGTPRAIMPATEQALLPAPLAVMQEVAEFMASSGPMVPAHFQNNPQACFAIVYQAARWRMDPFAVAQKAYITQDRNKKDRISYEAQLVKAVIDTNAPLVGVLEITFHDDGQQRYCKVTGMLQGARRPSVLSSPRLINIWPKNSPLWFNDPDQQLSYYSCRAWARRYCPGVLMGIYTPDEIGVMDEGQPDAPTRSALAYYDDAQPQAESEPSGGEAFKKQAAGKTDGHPNAPDDGGPSGGGSHKSGGSKQQAKAEARDLGPNPWGQVDDIMEWVAVFGGEIEAATDPAALDKLIKQAQGHGLLPRLKRESEVDWKTLSEKASDRREVLVKDGEAS